MCINSFKEICDLRATQVRIAYRLFDYIICSIFKIGGQVKASILWQELKNRFLRYFAHK